MSERIITLFGEEIVPEQLKAVGRSRAKKKNDEKAETTPENATPTDTEEQPITGTIPTEEAVEIVAVAPEQAPIVEPVTEAVIADTPVADILTTDIVAELITDMPTGSETLDEPEVKEKKKKEKTAPVNIPEDWSGSKQYYSIGEVAELFKVKTSHIRFWTNEFKLKVRTTRKGDRLYTPEQIKELRAINHLVKERGFTLNGAKSRLKAPEKMEVETVDLKQSLLQLRNKLVAIKNQLK